MQTDYIPAFVTAVVVLTLLLILIYSLYSYSLIRISRRHIRTEKQLPEKISFKKTGLFNWSNHPSLIHDAVEHGWTRFAFQNSRDSIDISWEVSPGSSDWMQKIRMNRGGVRRTSTTVEENCTTVVKTEFPLPGPLLDTSAFPQEAYFEIKVARSVECGEASCELEEAKLIKEKRVEGLASLCLGLAASGDFPMKFPGSYPGSIGFNSNGSVYLDGVKLVFESEKGEWGHPDKVIGCGYNPSEKKVFFTENSELVRVINCKAEEYGAPLFPTLGANTDVTVLVNLGQSSFKYAPANSHRTPNPCFIMPSEHSPSTAAAESMRFEDSSELFSMGVIDAQWLQRFTAPKTTQHQNNDDTLDEVKKESNEEVSDSSNEESVGYVEIVL